MSKLQCWSPEGIRDKQLHGPGALWCSWDLLIQTNLYYKEVPLWSFSPYPFALNNQPGMLKGRIFLVCPFTSSFNRVPRLVPSPLLLGLLLTWLYAPVGTVAGQGNLTPAVQGYI